MRKQSKCKEHPTYKGAREPRVSCLTCYRVWLDKHPKIKERYA